jgi:predicted P-loop ATPase
MTVGERTRQVDDDAANALWFQINEKFRFLPSYEMFRRFLDTYAKQKPFHPVRDYLESLEWDGEPRLDKWLVVLRAAVVRVYSPGAKFDELLVLESDQGWDKSTALATLCPSREWFTDNLPMGVDSKIVIERTKGIWIAEIAELFGMTKREIDQVKVFLSRSKDGPVRLAYGRDSTHVQRQFVCIATTNRSVYLKDPTGNRRFWPVRVGHFDVEALARDRDQLWAEAHARRNESIRLDREFWGEARAQQQKRETTDPWERELAEIFVSPPEHFLLKNKNHLYVRPGDDGFGLRASESQIYEALGIPVDRQDEKSQSRVYSIMERLGFKRMQVRRGGVSARGWGKDS